MKDDPNIIHGRPDLEWYASHPRVGLPWGTTRAKKHPPYVFGVSSNAALIHKIHHVDLRWWEPKYDHMVRLHRPHMTATAICGQIFFLAGNRSRTCMVPRPDAIRCVICHGIPDARPFSKEGWATKAEVTRHEAHVKLGCIVEGY